MFSNDLIDDINYWTLRKLYYNSIHIRGKKIKLFEHKVNKNFIFGKNFIILNTSLNILIFFTNSFQWHK